MQPTQPDSRICHGTVARRNTITAPGHAGSLCSQFQFEEVRRGDLPSLTDSTQIRITFHPSIMDPAHSRSSGEVHLPEEVASRMYASTETQKAIAEYIRISEEIRKKIPEQLLQLVPRLQFEFDELIPFTVPCFITNTSPWLSTKDILIRLPSSRLISWDNTRLTTVADLISASLESCYEIYISSDYVYFTTPNIGNQRIPLYVAEPINAIVADLPPSPRGSAESPTENRPHPTDTDPTIRARILHQILDKYFDNRPESSLQDWLASEFPNVPIPLNKIVHLLDRIHGAITSEEQRSPDLQLAFNQSEEKPTLQSLVLLYVYHLPALLGSKMLSKSQQLMQMLHDSQCCVMPIISQLNCMAKRAQQHTTIDSPQLPFYTLRFEVGESNSADPDKLTLHEISTNLSNPQLRLSVVTIRIPRELADELASATKPSETIVTTFIRDLNTLFSKRLNLNQRDNFTTTTSRQSISSLVRACISYLRQLVSTTLSADRPLSISSKLDTSLFSPHCVVSESLGPEILFEIGIPYKFSATPVRTFAHSRVHLRVSASPQLQIMVKAEDCKLLDLAASALRAITDRYEKAHNQTQSIRPLKLQITAGLPACQPFDYIISEDGTLSITCSPQFLEMMAKYDEYRCCKFMQAFDAVVMGRWMRADPRDPLFETLFHNWHSSTSIRVPFQLSQHVAKLLRQLPSSRKTPDGLSGKDECDLYASIQQALEMYLPATSQAATTQRLQHEVNSATQLLSRDQLAELFLLIDETPGDFSDIGHLAKILASNKSTLLGLTDAARLEYVFATHNVHSQAKKLFGADAVPLIIFERLLRGDSGDKFFYKVSLKRPDLNRPADKGRLVIKLSTKALAELLAPTPKLSESGQKMINEIHTFLTRQTSSN